jgi:hypothetical protein
MSVAFLEKFQARRVGGRFTPNLSPTILSTNREIDTVTKINLGREVLEGDWTPKDIAPYCPLNWQWRPRRFVDGKDLGRVIAWLEDPEGYPVPLRLAQVGAAVLKAVPESNGQARLVVEHCEAMPVIALAADVFPWRDVESFAAVAQAKGYRLVVADRPTDIAERCDFPGLSISVRSRTIRAMSALESQMVQMTSRIPTVVDGLLQQKIRIDQQSDPVTGVIKTHTVIPLHPLGIQVLSRLKPFQRTPAYERILADMTFITWYLRLGPNDGDPQQRVVRIEICKQFFEEIINENFEYINMLSRCLCESRTHDPAYKRNAITLQPIQRTEEIIRAGFLGIDTLENRFCQTMGIYL